MKITVVRHGETEGNVQRIIQSRTGGTLTTLGKQQARSTGMELLHEHFDVVYCSDLQRCIETAEIILPLLPAARLVITKQLRERSQGIYEGKKWEDLPWIDFEGENIGKQIPEGESWLMVRARIAGFINDIYESQPDGNVLLITHAGPVKAVKSLLGGITLEQSIDEPILNGTIWRGELNSPLVPETMR